MVKRYKFSNDPFEYKKLGSFMLDGLQFEVYGNFRFGKLKANHRKRVVFEGAIVDRRDTGGDM